MAPTAVIGHVAPEAAVGGTIGLVHEGDSITVDANKLLIQLNVDEAELERRRNAGRLRPRSTAQGSWANMRAWSQVPAAAPPPTSD